jgi:hypothetical protein
LIQKRKSWLGFSTEEMLHPIKEFRTLTKNDANLLITSLQKESLSTQESPKVIAILTNWLKRN